LNSCILLEDAFIRFEQMHVSIAIPENSNANMRLFKSRCVATGRGDRHPLRAVPPAVVDCFASAPKIGARSHFTCRFVCTFSIPSLNGGLCRKGKLGCNVKRSILIIIIII